MTTAPTPNPSPAPDAGTSESADEAAGVTAQPDVVQRAGEVSPIEEGRRLASERDDLIAAGVNPSDLLIPVPPSHLMTTPEDDAVRHARIDEIEKEIDDLAHEHNVACAFGSPTCPAFTAPEDDLPTTSPAELDTWDDWTRESATPAVVIAMGFAVVVIVAVVAAVRWFGVATS